MKTFIPFLIMLAGLTSTVSAQQPIDLTWRYANHPESNQNFELVIKNPNNNSFDLKDYYLRFNSLLEINTPSRSDIVLAEHAGLLLSFEFLQNTVLDPTDSIVINYTTRSPATHRSMVPTGFYLHSKTDPQVVIAIDDPTIITPKLTDEENRIHLAALYNKNSSLTSNETQLILPSPYSIKAGGDEFILSGQATFFADPAFGYRINEELASLAAHFPSIQFQSVAKAQAKVVVEKIPGLAAEEYKLKIADDQLLLQASDPAGAYYGIQTLRSLLPANYLEDSLREIRIAATDIHDKPRYAYRGLMLDVARRFRGLDVLKKYIEVMGRYKLNRLHLHFIDDEGWRLEIPGLPELTEVGARRTPLYTEGSSLPPSYGSGAVPMDRQYLTRDEFKELIRFAADHFVTVIPEIETPGHARASIKAMEARYHRLMEEGDEAEAKRFLMTDFEDKSTYRSVQYWPDNVMNVALPGTYEFLGYVLDELKKMYQEVGVELQTVSIGGDEVPAGAWEGSPKVQELMRENKIISTHDLWPYYVEKVQNILEEKGLQMAGWEEIGMINKGDGMVVNDELAYLGFQLDVWNNVIGQGQEDLAYQLANAGYRVVFTSATNFYFDMVWDNDFREPGLLWASKTDLYHAFSLLPEAYFANLHHTARGEPLGERYFNQKRRLTEKGKTNFLGLKGALWSETIIDDERMDYMIFPRLFALAERAWAPQQSLESDEGFVKKAFDETYAAFRNKVGHSELQKLNHTSGGFHYRLPSVGLKEERGRVLANLEYPGFTIHYTVDGTDPNDNSLVFPAEGIVLQKGQTIRAVSVSKDGRMGRVSEWVLSSK